MFARENFLGIKTMQTIAQLKRQLLELLSAAGFVKQGLRARAVEAAGRRAGGSDGVSAVLNDSGRGDLSENDWNCKACGASVFASKKSCYRCGMPKDPDERRIDPSDGGAYTFSEFVDEYGGTDEWTAAAPMFSTEDVPAPLVPVNERLLKALLCAALYPQVVLVETPEPKKGGKSKGGGGGGGGAIKFKIREGSDPKAEPVAVALHPSSVNARTTTFESKYLIYAEKVKTTQIYVRDCAPASPFAIMIFGGALKAERGSGGGGGSSDDAVLVVDAWIRFRLPFRVATLVLGVRAQLAAVLQKKIERPTLELSVAGKGILDAVTALLEQSV
jgi:ribosomal protein L37E